MAVTKTLAYHYLDTKFVELVKTSSFMFDKLTFAKSNFVTLSLIFINKKVIFPNFANFLLLANVFLGMDTQCGCMGVLRRKEGGIQVSACLAPSSQTVGSALRTPWQIQLK